MKTFISKSIIVSALCMLAIFATALGVARPAFAACGENEQEISLPIESGGTKCIPKSDTQDLSQNPIFYYLRTVLVWLAGGVGLAIVGGIIFGSYLYITARGNVGQTEKGQDVIISSVVSLLLFIFMYAILQFVIPGGVFK